MATIASQNILLPGVGPEIACQLVNHIDQTQESDTNLLTRLARQFDVVATIKAKRLLLYKAGYG